MKIARRQCNRCNMIQSHQLLLIPFTFAMKGYASLHKTFEILVAVNVLKDPGARCWDRIEQIGRRASISIEKPAREPHGHEISGAIRAQHPWGTNVTCLEHWYLVSYVSIVIYLGEDRQNVHVKIITRRLPMSPRMQPADGNLLTPFTACNTV